MTPNLHSKKSVWHNYASLKASSSVKQILICLGLVIWLIWFCFATNALPFHDPSEDEINPWVEYGTTITVLVMACRLVSMLGIPQTCFNLIGLVRFNIAQESIQLKSSPTLAPFVCIRVVTRGLYPKLVKDTVANNLTTLSKAGMENYILQVVTDVPIHMKEEKRVQELVVPSTYKTKSGALNKARALQYCLEDDINTLGEDDWIVHLDEETLLTERSVKGILNFICDGKHDFGQGLITYASNPVTFRSWIKQFQHRICTVADSFRVADDLGKLRCQLKIFHKPIFGWKGSYVVTRFGAERAVSFDNGPEGSKAEDCFFGMVAMDNGYSFDFIEGEMLERSPFTFEDFFKQRKRWIQGIYMVVNSSRISVGTKLLLSMSFWCWLTLPLSVVNLVLSKIFIVRTSPIIDLILSMVGGMVFFMYLVGYLKQHHVKRYTWIQTLFIIPEIIASSLLSIVIENLAVCTIWMGDWYDFYIVEKEPEDDKNNNMNHKLQV